ncbi:hypothetical protein TNCV_1378801 [Trichonephila clavipes]|nr:hypothetical protein TNCV_1378801 [Trichonephila clavipes]
MTCDVKDCGFQMLNDDKIVTSVQKESDPVDDKTDENDSNNNESSKSSPNAAAFSALETAMEYKPDLKEDDIVLIKEEGPPGTWPMARVLQVHPGNDGLVRVATVKTQDSVFKRPVHKLPIYPN